MRIRFRDLIKRSVAVLTSLTLSVTALTACEDDDISSSENSSSVQSSHIDPPDSASEVESGEIDDIHSLVCSTVEYMLSDKGFETGTGVAYTTENDHYEAAGIYYYNDDFKLINDDTVRTVGFIEIVSDSAEYYNADEEESLIVVDDTVSNNDNVELVCAYNYANLGSSHFIYQNKYVTFYQQSSMRIVYTETEDDPDNYDLTLGSLFDYDKMRYIYDEEIFSGEYQTHSSVGALTDEDYDELAETLKEISKEQEKNGYSVEEYSVVYISPENVQAYLDSHEEATFFGYNVNELTNAFGLGVGLKYTENGFVETDYRDGDPAGFNWKSFLTKVGIGCGIIIVSAVLSPITGGASFGCALISITSKATGFAVASGLGRTAVETVKGLINGKSFKESILGSVVQGLDSFSTGFMIGAAIYGVGNVVSNLITPKASQSGDVFNVDSQRSKAVKDAWKHEQEAVKNGVSRYNWTEAQKAEIINTGKIKGCQGHHIITVKQLENTINEKLIGSADDIVFLTPEEHLAVHMGNFSNPTNMDVLVKLRPGFAETIQKMEKMVA